MYLLPLGVMAAGYGFRAAWVCLILAVIGNGVWSAGTAVFSAYPWDQTAGGLVHFAVIAAVFTWVMAPSFTDASEPVKKYSPARVPGVYRFVAASCVVALLILPVIASLRQNTAFSGFIRTQAEALSALYTASAGADVVRQSLLEQYLTPDFIVETLIFSALRGGVTASCMVFFFINRQIALTLVWVFRRIRRGRALADFHVPPVFIWVLSFSLLAVLVGKKWGISFLEIMAWNGLVVCGILYLAQGGGIVAYSITRTNLPPFFRLALNVFFVMLIFSPGINVVLLGGLILLGIAENWAPFRAPKIKGPSSTPGM
ncbi:MAG: YybS family protein [Spirochaetaceae bacterium]|nr:YybS family protein [Spirochaetaceae bacterium]